MCVYVSAANKGLRVGICLSQGSSYPRHIERLERRLPVSWIMKKVLTDTYMREVLLTCQDEVRANFPELTGEELETRVDIAYGKAIRTASPSICPVREEEDDAPCGERAAWRLLCEHIDKWSIATLRCDQHKGIKAEFFEILETTPLQ